MPTTREEHDKAMDAIHAELVTVGDRLVDQGHSFDLIWLSMLMMVFQVLVHQKGKDAGRQVVKEIAEDYFGHLSLEDEALIQRGSDPFKKTH
jgi:hypothetical protein